MLIGHAASLLALQFEPPREAAEAGWALNAAAVGLLLTGEADLSAARRLVATVADETGHVRAMVLSAPPDKAVTHYRTYLVLAPTAEDAPAVKKIVDDYDLKAKEQAAKAAEEAKAKAKHK